MVQIESNNPAFVKPSLLQRVFYALCALLAVCALAWTAVSLHRQTVLRELEAHNRAAQGINEFLFRVADDAELNDIYVRGKLDFNSLNPAEKSRASLVVQGLFYNLCESYRAWRAGVLTDADYKALKLVMGGLMRSSLFTHFWQERQITFPADFRAEIDGLPKTSR